MPGQDPEHPAQFKASAHVCVNGTVLEWCSTTRTTLPTTTCVPARPTGERTGPRQSRRRGTALGQMVNTLLPVITVALSLLPRPAVSVCSQEWCSSPGPEGGTDDCWAGFADPLRPWTHTEACSCTRGEARETRKTGAMPHHGGETVFEYTCCDDADEPNQGLACGDSPHCNNPPTLTGGNDIQLTTYLTQCCPVERAGYASFTAVLVVLQLGVIAFDQKSFNRHTGDTAPTTLLAALATTADTRTPDLSQALLASDYGGLLEAQAHPDDARQLANQIDTWVTRGACGAILYAAILLSLTITWSVRGHGLPFAVDAFEAFLCFLCKMAVALLAHTVDRHLGFASRNVAGPWIKLPALSKVMSGLAALVWCAAYITAETDLCAARDQLFAYLALATVFQLLTTIALVLLYTRTMDAYGSARVHSILGDSWY